MKLSTSRWLPLVAVATWFAAVGNVAYHFGYQYYGLDFYHLWGIPIAREAVGGNPFAGVERYSQALNAVAEASPSGRVHMLNPLWRTIQPTGTPLIYMLAHIAPRSFDLGYVLLLALDFVALGASCYAMARMRGFGRWAAGMLGGLAALTFYPFLTDMRVGNVSTLQLALIVAATALCAKAARAPRASIDIACAAVLVALAAMKPTTGLVALALAAHFAWVRGAQAAMRALAAALVVAALLWFATGTYFHDLGVWSDWLAYVHANFVAHPFRIEHGNVALVAFAAERAPVLGATGYGVLFAIAWAGCLVVAIGARSRDAAGACARAARALEDPAAVASVAVVLTFAVSPLVWIHYLSWLLVPIVFSIRPRRAWDVAGACAIAAWILLSQPVLDGLLAAGWARAFRFALWFGWLAAVPAVCARIASTDAPPQRRPVQGNR